MGQTTSLGASEWDGRSDSGREKLESKCMEKMTLLTTQNIIRSPERSGLNNSFLNLEQSDPKMNNMLLIVSIRSFPFEDTVESTNKVSVLCCNGSGKARVVEKWSEGTRN